MTSAPHALVSDTPPTSASGGWRGCGQRRGWRQPWQILRRGRGGSRQQWAPAARIARHWGAHAMMPTVSVLQAALVELATANTELERKVAVLEAAQTLPGEDAGDALCDTVLGRAASRTSMPTAYLSAHAVWRTRRP